jgi:hypothetical protein
MVVYSTTGSWYRAASVSDVAVDNESVIGVVNVRREKRKTLAYVHQSRYSMIGSPLCFFRQNSHN